MSNTEESAQDAARRFARRLTLTEDMLYSAWAVISNARAWTSLHRDKQDHDWLRAAEKWRDEWHDYMKTQGENMTQLTPIHHLIRNGFSIFFEDMARNRHLLCECVNSDVAQEIGQILATHHGVELVNEPPKSDSSTGNV